MISCSSYRGNHLKATRRGFKCMIYLLLLLWFTLKALCGAHLTLIIIIPPRFVILLSLFLIYHTLIFQYFFTYRVALSLYDWCWFYFLTVAMLAWLYFIKIEIHSSGCQISICSAADLIKRGGMDGALFYTRLAPASLSDIEVVSILSFTSKQNNVFTKMSNDLFRQTIKQGRPKTNQTIRNWTNQWPLTSFCGCDETQRPMCRFYLIQVAPSC